MSSIGLYRYKTTVEDARVVAFFKNGVQAGLATIKAIPFCEGYRILKYLDPEGRYRFFPFNNYYESRDKPKQIGTTNEFITNILTDQSNSKNIGYKNSRILSLTTEADAEQLEVLSVIYTSPRVYLYIGKGVSDAPSDWLLLDSIKGDNIGRRRKNNTGAVNIECTLPEWFTIKSI